MTTIDCIDQWGFWRQEYEIVGEIEIMHHMLKNHTLDPVFLEYGRFYEKDPLNQRGEPLYAPGTTHFFGNFYDASCVFRFASDEAKIVEPMIKAIEENIASERFIVAKQASEKNLRDIREARERRERHELAEARRRARAVLGASEE